MEKGLLARNYSLCIIRIDKKKKKITLQTISETFESQICSDPRRTYIFTVPEIKISIE